MKGLLGRFSRTQRREDELAPENRLRLELLTRWAGHELRIYDAHQRKYLSRLVREGLLREASLPEKVTAKYRIEDLKPLLRERGLKVSGKKAELVASLLDALSEKEAQSLVTGFEMYEATEEGQKRIDWHLEFCRQERQAAMDQCTEALLASEYERAALVVSAFEAKQPFPRGLGVEWSAERHHFDLRELRDLMEAMPWFLEGLTTEDQAQARLAAAMAYLWGTGPQKAAKGLEIGSGTKYEPMWLVNLLMSYAANRRALRDYRGSGVVKKIAILAADSSCEACKQAAREYPFDRVPELPLRSCTAESGCRCAYAPVTKTWRELGIDIEEP